MSHSLSAVSSGSEDHARKRMRKGTRSCQECRRRKIRCVFQPNAQICNGCAPRGVECIEQNLGESVATPLEKRKNVRDRLGQLEDMVGQILHKLDAKDGGSLESSERDAVEALRGLQSELMPPSTARSGGSTITTSSKLATGTSSDVLASALHPINHFKNSPLLSLFDNAILSHSGQDSAVVGPPSSCTIGPQVSKDKNSQALKTLKALAPSADELAIILRGSEASLPLWLTVMPELMDGVPCEPEELKIEVLRDKFLQFLDSNSLAMVAKVLLIIALLLQQLPVTFDHSRANLPVSQEALEEHYIQPVETLLALDEGLASSGVDAVACMCLQSKFYMNIGKPGKGWLVNRRAMAFAQLIGLHHRQVGQSSDKQSTRKHNLWLSIWQHDRISSLILGLPYSIPETHFGLDDINSEPSGGPPTKRFMLMLGLVTGRIIDRNHCPTNMTFARTLEIDEELERIKESMPKEWWETSPGPEMSVGATFDICICKFWFHDARKLLHLPFMLKSFTDRRYEYSKVAALESSREIAKHYEIFRDRDKPILSMCDIIDFEAFTGVMVLILHILGRSPSCAIDPEEGKRDWDIIHTMTRTMKRVSEDMKCNVAAQAARILEDFGRARDFDCSSSPDDDSYEAVIPYFGKLRLHRRRNFHQPAPSAVTPGYSNQLQSPPDSISTGSELYEGPLVSIDSYFQPLPFSEETPSLNGMGADWTSTVNMDLRDDWSWFLNGPENVQYMS
jgi:hypothetical protein